MADTHRHARRRLGRIVAVVAALAVALPALAASAGAASTPQGARTQKSGGNINYGLEAETTDYCLTRAQLAISGIQVVSAIYDTLTVPNDKGVAVPYLAKTVTPNSDFTQWTIGLRSGVQFQDGEPLDAAAVKLNLDSYRGAPGAPNVGPLFPLVLKFVSDVSVVDPMTVKVTLAHAVPSFPQYLYGVGRAGIMAPAQINAGDACSTKMIGTGPFKLQTYLQNEKTVVVKNPNYWQKGFPKADSITFVPVVDGATRNTQLQGGQLDMEHQSNAQDIDQLKGISSIKLMTQQPGVREIAYYFLDSAKAPFNNQAARTAFATAVNRTEINQIRNKGLFEVSNSLMDRSAPGYVKNAGYPAFDLKKAQTLVSQVKAANGGQFNLTLGTTTDPANSAEAQLLKEQLAKAGINADIAQFDQATLINKALAHAIDVLLWRNLHGGYTDFNDADTIPWFSNGPADFINFGGFADPTTQSLLDQGQTASNPTTIKSTYQMFNKTMAAKGYLLPTWYVNWTIGYQPSVTLNLPPLPDGHGKPLFVYGRIPVLGLSKA